MVFVYFQFGNNVTGLKTSKLSLQNIREGKHIVGCRKWLSLETVVPLPSPLLSPRGRPARPGLLPRVQPLPVVSLLQGAGLHVCPCSHATRIWGLS